jgi:hypothetical protein
MNEPQEMTAIAFDTEKGRELAASLHDPLGKMVDDYLHQFADGPCEAQEMTDRLDGLLIGLEAGVFSALMMVSETLGVPLPILANVSLNRLGSSIGEMCKPRIVQ